MLGSESMCLFWRLAGDSKTLQFVHHFHQQTQRLGVFLHAVRHSLRYRHHLLPEISSFTSTRVYAAGNSMDGGPQLIQALLLREHRS